MHSFDIFDTLITRTTATPQGIFALMQDELLNNERYKSISEYIRNNFFCLRVNAEEFANANYCEEGVESVTLKDIYDSLASIGSLNKNEIDDLINLEMLLEYKNTIGISQNIQLLKDKVAIGERVVLISDMYLSGQFIRKLLLKSDSIFEDIPIYISSEYGRTKYTGNLYTIVREKEKISINEQWIHYGDNITGDIQSAKCHNINAIHYPFEPLMSYERKVLGVKREDVFCQLSIGAARNTRLLNKYTGSSAIGGSLGGVILYPYVSWLLKESVEKGIHRLYFVARDGWILKRIADIIIKELDYNIKTYYIYGSRKAWRMASICKKNCDIKKIVQWSNPETIKSIMDLSELFQIKSDELLRFLPEDLQKCFLSDTHIHLGVVEYTAEVLNNSNEFKMHLCKLHRQKREMVIDYLKQEVDFKDDSFAFVELAGSGLTMGCMADIVGDFYTSPVKVFYYKMDKLNLMNNYIAYNFLPSNLYLSYILEVFCRAPHGMTNGYYKLNKTVYPEISEGEGKALQEYGYEEYIKGVESYVQILVRSIHNTTHCKAEHIHLILTYLNEITRTPDSEVLQFIGDMPFSVSERDRDIVKFAPALTEEQIEHFFSTGFAQKYYNGAALEYSILRCSNSEKRKIEEYQNSRFRQVRYSFPKELARGRNIIYGAGKVGKQIHQQLLNQEDSEVVLWVDEKHEVYQKKGRKVSKPTCILSADYDRIIIAVLDKRIADSIRCSLIEMGVPQNKIIWIYPVAG